MAFELPQLGYAHDALEPYFDARTMEIHHGKHHAGYTSKLNAAVEGTDMEGKSIEELLATIQTMQPFATTAVVTTTTACSGKCFLQTAAALQQEIWQRLLTMHLVRWMV